MTDREDRNRADVLWMIAAAGLVLGAIVTVAGVSSAGVGVTVVGVILLAFGGGALFTYLGRRSA